MHFSDIRQFRHKDKRIYPTIVNLHHIILTIESNEYIITKKGGNFCFIIRL